MADDDLFPSAHKETSLDRQIACARREVNKRVQVYKRWVAEGRMTQAFADSEIQAMRDIATSLVQLKSMRERGLS
jgi:hypothetical protein